jgi:hypothetical protein
MRQVRARLVSPSLSPLMASQKPSQKIRTPPCVTLNAEPQ